MPEPLERYFVLHKCNEHSLERWTHLLWFCQYGDAFQWMATSDYRITDGGCTSKKGRKTFYKEADNDRKSIIQLMNTMGFEVS